MKQNKTVSNKTRYDKIRQKVYKLQSIMDLRGFLTNLRGFLTDLRGFLTSISRASSIFCGPLSSKTISIQDIASSSSLASETFQ